jgi:phospholipid/cholesterol/gamma-HCH transport system substrate-binding protein
MKISNETKVGALTAVAITVLILGFNYLKGKDLSTRNDYLYAVFPHVEGLLVSSPVLINGLQVGKVGEIVEKDENISGIIVGIKLTKNVNIPDNSVALITSELLQSTSVVIRMGSSSKYAHDGDTILTQVKPGIMDEVRSNLNPTLNSVNRALNSLDSLIQKVSMVIDPHTKNNLQNAIANLAATTASMRRLVDAQQTTLTNTLANVESITGNFKNNNQKIDSALSNIQAATAKLAGPKVDEMINNLNGTSAKLNAILDKANSKEGTIGLLLNDRKFYDEIRETNRSLNTLLDDFRLHPKRYVNVSVFGRKDKSGPIEKPVYDSVRN